MSSHKREMSSKLELGWSIVIFDKFIRFVGCLKTTKNISCSGREINRHVHISKPSNAREQIISGQIKHRNMGARVKI